MRARMFPIKIQFLPRKSPVRFVQRHNLHCGCVCSSASEFSLQQEVQEDFWPESHNSLSHLTADRARPPRRRPPSSQLQDRQEKPVYYIADTDLTDHVEVNELVLADYVSSHSFLDSILTTIDVDKVNLNVEFPEYGKCLMESPVEDPQAQTGIRTKTWGDNWKVDGVEKFEEQVFRDLEERRQSKDNSQRSPEIVPFLVPSSTQAKVVIGDKDIDDVSVLSEKMSEGSIEFSSSSQEEEGETEEVIRTSHDAELTHSGRGEESSLVLVSAPTDSTVMAGRILALSCVVEGVKPIGRRVTAGATA